MDVTALSTGDRVELHSLSSAKFNGRTGVVLKYSEKHARWAIKLDGDEKGALFKEQNLKVSSESPRTVVTPPRNIEKISDESASLGKSLASAVVEAALETNQAHEELDLANTIAARAVQTALDAHAASAAGPVFQKPTYIDRTVINKDHASINPLGFFGDMFAFDGCFGRQKRVASSA